MEKKFLKAGTWDDPLKEIRLNKQLNNLPVETEPKRPIFEWFELKC